MSNALALAQQYFDLSNARDLAALELMLTESTTYSSQNTGVYLGKESIMEMKYKFYGSFQKMHWDIHSISEVRKDVFLFDFTFSGTTHEGEKIIRPGLEYVIIYQNMLQHIEVRNKN